MNVYSWIFVAVLGAAFVATVTTIICKYVYAKKACTIMKRACNFTEEERETYKKMLKNNSNSLGVNIFELFDNE